VNDIKNHLCDGNAVPSIINETVSTAHVDGNNGLGSVVGKFCMELAMAKAKETGIGWVSAK
jgi:LDH2 family malate/lactate/ureidoglycolate dehydrogenase